MLKVLWTNLCGLVVLGSISSQAWSAPVMLEALAQPRYDLRLGFTLGGRVVKMPVKVGDRVQEGQTLIELEDADGVYALEVTLLRAASDIEERGRAQELKLALLEEQRLADLVKTNAAAPVELDRAQIRARLAELELAMAKQKHQEVELQLKQAQNRQSQYTLKAPRAGVVEMTSVEVGETVEALKPVLRLVTIDPLLVEAWVPTAQTIKLAPQGKAWVHCQLGDRKQVLEGTILSVAQVTDSGSGLRLVRIEAANPNLWPAGTQVQVSFEAPAVSESTPSPQPPATQPAQQASKGDRP